MEKAQKRPLDRFYSLIFYFIISVFIDVSIAADAITPKSISDGQTQVSSRQIFELVFFSPGKSKGRYVGIWYKNISVRTYVWVANRENPLTDSSRVLMITDNENLILINQTRSIFWSSNSSTRAKNLVAKLLDSGNLVIRDGTWKRF
uniref:Bulb-type lectin domain-containing protein n=1 Tax=Nelumbo nucifera TaxID=4432 RepID=A0A822XNC9_NELNU|nr:TPA_asm: hypothetical protein HUJ06_022164 [Nelumbo nucifera]